MHIQILISKYNPHISLKPHKLHPYVSSKNQSQSSYTYVSYKNQMSKLIYTKYHDSRITYQPDGLEIVQILRNFLSVFTKQDFLVIELIISSG